MPTTKLPEEREVVVDSGASTHMLSQKDLSSDELETLRRSRNPTVVVTANGEVQTNEEAQVYVHDLGLFVTVYLLDDTPAVLSLGELCSEHGYSYEWTSGQNPQLTKNGKDFLYKTENVYLLLFMDCRQVLVPARLLHRHRRTHQVLRVQQQSEVTSRQRQISAIQQNIKTKTKKESN